MDKEEFKRRLFELCVEAEVELFADHRRGSWFQPNFAMNCNRGYWELHVDRRLEHDIDQALNNHGVTTAKETDEN